MDENISREEQIQESSDIEEAKKKTKNFLKGLKTGGLHRDLGVKQGDKIPASKLADKPGDSALVRKRKNFARNARKWNK